MLKALGKRPEDRYATAAAFAEDLRRWLSGIPTVAGNASHLKRIGMWMRRRPAVAFAAGMTAAFVIVSLLEAGQAVHVNRLEAMNARAETATARAEARAAEQVARADRRELDLINLSRYRAPIRLGGWFETAWNASCALAAGRPDEDGRFQGQFAALLDGLDIRLSKAFEKDADMLAFDPTGKRLLMGRRDRDARGHPVTRLAMGDLADQQEPTEKSFKSLGVVGFISDGTALFVECDAADSSILRLRNAITGDEKRILKSPLNGASRFIAMASLAMVLAPEVSSGRSVNGPQKKWPRSQKRPTI